MKPFFALPQCPSCGVQLPYRTVVLSWIGKRKVCRRCKKKIKLRFTGRTVFFSLVLVALCFLINGAMMGRINNILPLLFVTFLLVAAGFLLLPLTMGIKIQKK